MQGEAKVIEVLNDVLTGELTAINQYFLHARMLKNWGYERLAEKVYKESIDEMKHSQTLTDRILFLEGMPNLQKIGKLNIGEKVQEQFQADMDLEIFAIARLKNGIKTCFDLGDHTSRHILEHILSDEEEHLDWLEAQNGIIKEVGIENYLAEQIG